jgi:glycogen operon protein
MVGALATRLAGSSDLYEPSGRKPYHSINFITSHDGFTLNDLVSYEQKHNDANGEGNRDGDDHNYSCNYGVEGPTRRKATQDLRLRQAKNFLTTLFVSQGVPMLLAGDECLRTQRGNNNAYCQDNVISWFDWHLVEKNAGLTRFCQALISFRRQQPALRRTSFLTGTAGDRDPLPDVTWFSWDGKPMDWNHAEQSLVCLLGTSGLDDSHARPVLLLIHAGSQPLEFVFPEVVRHSRWRLLVDTSAEAPDDIFPDGGPPPPAGCRVWLDHHSLKCYVASEPMRTARRG